MSLTPSQINLARETLDLVDGFLTELSPLSNRLGDHLESEGKVDLTRLIDGISLTLESVDQIRGAIETEQSVQERSHEALLGELLAALLRAVENGNKESQIRILTGELPTLLDQWKKIGISALRDPLK